MVTSLFTTHFLVTTTPTAMAAVDLDALAAVMVSTARTHSQVVDKAHRMSKAVTMAVAAVAQELLGQAHQVTVV